MKRRSNPTFQSKIFDFTQEVNYLNGLNFQTTNSEFFKKSALNFADKKQDFEHINAKDVCTNCANNHLNKIHNEKSDQEQVLQKRYQNAIIETDKLFKNYINIEKQNDKTKNQQIVYENHKNDELKKRNYTRERKNTKTSQTIENERMITRENYLIQKEKENAINQKEIFTRDLQQQILQKNARLNHQNNEKLLEEEKLTGLKIGEYKSFSKLEMSEFLKKQILYNIKRKQLEVNLKERRKTIFRKRFNRKIS